MKFAQILKSELFKIAFVIWILKFPPVVAEIFLAIATISLWEFINSMPNKFEAK
jgi:hypothetical protein